VGLFLAEYAAVTGDPGARRASLGALRHAFLKAERIQPGARRSLYTGWLGIALAAARAGMLFGQLELLDRALDLACGSTSEDSPRHEHDLLGGSAGGIVGCLALMSITQERALLDFAMRLGEDLVAASRLSKRTGALSWPTMSSKTAAPLTGFSHGAAGIGFALLELWNATGDSRFREAALGAFRYEQLWLDPLLGNWPDFREIGPGRGKVAEAGAHSYVTYWCHGAPGIALSRLRAHALTADPARYEEALVGVRATERAVRSDLSASSSDYSLCHGLAGNATVLLHAAHALEVTEAGSAGSSLEQLAQEAAEEGVRRYNANGWWACGVGGRLAAQTPALMLGLAGIGYFYLRLANPTLPSLLLIEPDAWASR
jgi:lantibiotic modifying enzyme